jgi:hypothetical protein
MALVEVNWKPEPRTLRVFAWICVVFFGLLGTWAHFGHQVLWIDLAEGSALVVARVLWAVAAGCGLVGLAAPKAILPLYWLLTVVSLPIGFVLSHVVMVLVYFGVFAPVALLFRIIGRDALHRRFDPDAGSYWVPRKPAADRQRYFRQY